MSEKLEKKEIKKQKKNIYATFAFIFGFLYLCSVPAYSQVMQSTNYQIESDSVNTSGVQSESTSFRLQDTTGELATGDSGSTSFNLHAGYQQMNEVYLAMTTPSNVNLSSLGGVTGGTSNGLTSTTITTDSLAGYELSIKAESSPALVGASGNFPDYSPGGTPSFTFSVSPTSSAFGFTPEGTDIVQKYLDDGVDTCNTGATNTASSCWNGLSTTDELIARRTGSNHPSGTLTTIRFRGEIGTLHIQPEGTYVATTTLTVISL